MFKQLLVHAGTAVFIGLSATTFSAYGANLSAFDAGKKAFEKGNYKEAVTQFEKAQKAGERRVALYYNLGVSYYRLGDMSAAKRNFKIVAQNRGMAALGHYNLGLVARKESDRETAISEFKKVKKISKDKKLIRLADQNLSEIYNYVGVWRGGLSARLGHDSNVTAAAEGTPAGASTFMTVGAYTDYLINGTRRDGLYFTGDLSLWDYASQNEDQNTLRVGLKKTTPWGKQSAYYAGYFSTSNYRGSAYQNIARLEAGTSKNLEKGANFQFRYRYDNINSLNPAYDYLQGWRQRFRAEHRMYGKDRKSRLYYEFEFNDRQDPNFAPNRHTFRGIYGGNLSQHWQWEGDLNFRVSDYPLRDDQRFRVSLTASRRIGDDLKFRARVRHTDNNSTDPAYSFGSNQVWAGVSYYY